MLSLAIFASGRGSNALSIIKHFKHSKEIKVACICSNNPNPGVFEYAEEYGIPYRSFTAEERGRPEILGAYLDEKNVSCIALAGYMKKIPQHLLDQFPDKILNIHPALLPKFGGQGMYGMNVHEAVVLANEKESGISIHLVNEDYDKGRILHQEKTDIADADTAELVAKKVLALEHQFYPRIIEKFMLGKI